MAQLENLGTHSQAIKQYLTYRADLHDTVKQRSDEQKMKIADRYNRGVTQVTHHVGDLVMLHQKNTRKLEARWRGPFQIDRYGGVYGLSFTLRQLNGRKIRGSFHGNDLKQFIPRAEHLARTTDTSLLPVFQTIKHQQSCRVRPA